VIANQAEIPFRFEIAQNGPQVQAFSLKGTGKSAQRRAPSENGKLRLEYDFLNTTLEATFEGDQFSGTYRNNAINGATQGPPPLEIHGAGSFR